MDKIERADFLAGFGAAARYMAEGITRETAEEAFNEMGPALNREDEGFLSGLLSALTD